MKKLYFLAIHTKNKHHHKDADRTAWKSHSHFIAKHTFGSHKFWQRIQTPTGLNLSISYLYYQLKMKGLNGAVENVNIIQNNAGLSVNLQLNVNVTSTRYKK